MAHGHHGHGHDGAHGHAHPHGINPGGGAGPALALGIALNVAFVIAEAVAGVLSRSTSLLADAAHNLSDVLGLVVAWVAIRLATARPTPRRTYGLRRGTILAALANAILLLVAVGGVLWESIRRLGSPPEVDASAIIVVAALGVVVNGASAALLVRSQSKDANVRGAFLHLAADAAVSAAVVAGGIAIAATGWRWLDPLISLVVCVVVLGGTFGLLRESMDLALDAVPRHVDPDAVLAYLRSLPAVREVHDLHIWSMSTTEVALTVHLVMPWNECPPGFLGRVERELGDRYGIQHATVQIEPDHDDTRCSRADGGAV